MINRQHFRVIGVNEKKGSVFGDSQDEFAVIPLGAAAGLPVPGPRAG